MNKERRAELQRIIDSIQGVIDDMSRTLTIICPKG